MRSAFILVSIFGLAVANPKPQLPNPGTPPPPLTSTRPPVEPIPEPLPTTSSSKGTPPTSPTNVPPRPGSPICECGYTYCASVLLGMKKPWQEKQLAEAYCNTPHAACTNHVPSTNITSALYICLCDDVDQKVGDHLDLVCGCDKCLNIGPDFRGRCETPCHAGNCQVELI